MEIKVYIIKISRDSLLNLSSSCTPNREDTNFGNGKWKR